jgi:hypothetical protein
MIGCNLMSATHSPPVDAGAYHSTPYLQRHVVPPLEAPASTPSWFGYTLLAVLGLYTGTVLAIGYSMAPEACLVKTPKGAIVRPSVAVKG